MEDYPWKYALIRDHGLISWKKLGDPLNWPKMGCHVGEVSVEKTTQSIIIHTGQLPGFDQNQLLVEAGQIIAIVRAILQDKGIELAEYGVPLHKPIFKFYTPESEAFNKELGTISTPEGSIDCSPPDKISHEERNRDSARAYMEMPERIKRSDDRLSQIENRLGQIETLQNKQLQVTERLIQAIEKNTEALEGDPTKARPPKDIGVI